MVSMQNPVQFTEHSVFIKGLELTQCGLRVFTSNRQSLALVFQHPMCAETCSFVSCILIQRFHHQEPRQLTFRALAYLSQRERSDFIWGPSEFSLLGYETVVVRGHFLSSWVVSQPKTAPGCSSGDDTCQDCPSRYAMNFHVSLKMRWIPLLCVASQSVLSMHLTQMPSLQWPLTRQTPLFEIFHAETKQSTLIFNNSKHQAFYPSTVFWDAFH